MKCNRIFKKISWKIIKINRREFSKLVNYKKYIKILMFIFIFVIILKIEYIREDNVIYNIIKICKIFLNKFNKKYI